MADEEIQNGKKGLGGLKLIIIVALAAILVGAGGFFMGKILSGNGEPKDPQQTETSATQDPVPVKGDPDNKEIGSNPETGEEGSSDATQTPGLLVLEKFTVNLNDPFGRRYAEILINLKISSKALVSKIQEHELVLPQIRDEIFMIISSKSYPELNSVSGKVTLKEEIMIRVNELIKETLGQEPVQDVFFGTFIIQ